MAILLMIAVVIIALLSLQVRTLKKENAADLEEYLDREQTIREWNQQLEFELRLHCPGCGPYNHECPKYEPSDSIEPPCGYCEGGNDPEVMCDACDRKMISDRRCWVCEDGTNRDNVCRECLYPVNE